METENKQLEARAIEEEAIDSAQPVADDAEATCDGIEDEKPSDANDDQAVSCSPDEVPVQPAEQLCIDGSKFEDESPWAHSEPDFDEYDDYKHSNPKNMHNKELGRRGEEAAARFLERKGFTIRERNWKCDVGEVDLIVEDESSVHFVEVKTRSNVRKGFPSEAVTAKKRRKYEIMAALYLGDYDRSEVAVCFDIISILVSSSEHALLRYHCNAFAGNGM